MPAGGEPFERYRVAPDGWWNETRHKRDTGVTDKMLPGTAR